MHLKNKVIFFFFFTMKGEIHSSQVLYRFLMSILRSLLSLPSGFQGFLFVLHVKVTLPIPISLQILSYIKFKSKISYQYFQHKSHKSHYLSHLNQMWMRLWVLKRFFHRPNSSHVPLRFLLKEASELKLTVSKSYENGLITFTLTNPL